MVNETILTGLLNLFALVSARNNGELDKCTTLLSDYLGRHFGLRNKQHYLNLYTDLEDLYSFDTNIDKEKIVSHVCTKIKGSIESGEQHLLLLRLMEFCRSTNENSDVNDDVYGLIAEQFGVDAEMRSDFVDFVTDKESDHVKKQTFAGYDGYIKTLWLDKERRMLFSYVGRDEVLFNDVPVLSGTFQVWFESGVLKNRHGAPVYYSAVRHAYENIGNNNVEFCGKNINFRFSNSDNGMHDLTFSLHSGEMVAIMGGSGAGKTTMLSLLNGTLIPQEGEITINGLKISDSRVKDKIGFVPQDDLLVEELTVYQNLYYTAKLCFDNMSEAEIDNRVMDVLRNLGLDKAKDLKVGSPINKVISGGQRKRLNIALELIREPLVLMLDEPTSGLSSADTEHVVGLLKEQTYKGKLVIMNIHQPSSDVYKAFDRLWLLDRGGYPVYDGNPIEAITYFKTAANYADAETSTCESCGNVNPEIVLNIIEEKALDNSGKLSSDRKTTPQQWHEMYLECVKNKDGVESETENKGVASNSSILNSDSKKPSVFSQFLIQLERNVMTKVTNMQYMLITLLEAPLLALICAYLTRYAPETGYSFYDNKNFVSFMFMAVIVSTFIGMSGSAEEIIRDRALLKREKFLQLSYGSYITSKIILQAFVSLIQTSLFVFVGLAVIGFNDLYLIWILVLFMTAFVANLTGLWLSKTLSSVVAIYITIPILLIPQILLCGLVIDFSDLNSKSTTGNVPFIGEVIPSRWAYEALAVSTFSMNEYEAPLFEMHKAQNQDQYYRMSFLYELQSQLETMQDEKNRGVEVKPVHKLVIDTELPRIAEICDMEEYKGDGSYESLKEYLEKADQILRNRSNKVTLDADRVVNRELARVGHEVYGAFRRSHSNEKLSDVLVNASSSKTHTIIDGHIVARVAQVYLDPVTCDGRAPFYSAYKRVGSAYIPTLWFNMMILAIMAIITAVFVYRKDK